MKNFNACTSLCDAPHLAPADGYPTCSPYPASSSEFDAGDAPNALLAAVRNG